MTTIDSMAAGVWKVLLDVGALQIITAKDAKAVIRPIVLLGYSMGGFVAQAMVGTALGRSLITGICLVSSAPANATTAIAGAQLARRLWSTVLSKLHLQTDSRHTYAVSSDADADVVAAAESSANSATIAALKDIRAKRKVSKASAVKPHVPTLQRHTMDSMNSFLPDCFLTGSGGSKWGAIIQSGCRLESSYQEAVFRHMHNRLGEDVVSHARVGDIEWAMEVAALAHRAMFDRDVSALTLYPGHVLVLHGALDSVIPKLATTYFRKIFNGRKNSGGSAANADASYECVIVANAGHGLPILKTDVVAGILVQWGNHLAARGSLRPTPLNFAVRDALLRVEALTYGLAASSVITLK
jgi:pimeloyl-ACP methyl ester carboxylesterase